MKKLGLIGGTSPESTAIYYREINRLIYEKTNGKAFPELTIESLNLNRVLTYCREERYAELTDYLLAAIQHLASCGAEFAALTANTLHLVFDDLAKRSPIPLVSIVDTVCEETVWRGFTRIGLLGTVFTMKEAFFKRPFLERGIQIITPTDSKMEWIHDRIIHELELGIVRDETTQGLLDRIDAMQKRDGIEAVILGCTELPLALHATTVRFRVLTPCSSISRN